MNEDHCLSKKEIVELLNQAPENACFRPNQLGNLAIIVDAEYIGYVCFRTKEVLTEDDINPKLP